MTVGDGAPSPSPIEGCVNFRDLGGLRTSDGRSTRHGVLFRSDSLHRLTAGDRRRLVSELGLRSALDLRSPSEHAATAVVPSGDDLHVEHLPLVDLGMQVPPGLEDRPIAERYVAMLATGAAALGSAVRQLARPERRPAVFFCLAGKDRTGLLSALVLGLAGVEPDEIVADYAATDRVMDRVQRAMAAEMPDQMAIWLQRSPQGLRAHAETMSELLGLVDARWGGFAGYAAGAGVSDETVRSLRAALVTPG